MGALTITTEQSQWTTEQLQALGLTTAPTADLLRFLHACQATGLDPFTRQIYFLPRYDNRKQETVWTIVGSIDGFRIVAQRSHEYEGQTDVEWCGPDGVWTEAWLDPSVNPAAARVGVWRKGFRQPLKAVALWKEYGGTQNNWRSMPAHMLAKVAEALALRKAFPHDLSGVYTTEEMDQAVLDLESVANNEQPTGEPGPTPESETIWDEPLRLLSQAGNKTELTAAWTVAARRKLIDTEVPGEGVPFRDLYMKQVAVVKGLGQAPAGDDGRPAVAPEEKWATVYLANGEVDMVKTLQNRINWIQEHPDATLDEADQELAENIARNAAAKLVAEKLPGSTVVAEMTTEEAAAELSQRDAAWKEGGVKAAIPVDAAAGEKAK